ncbi:MAG: alpha/beta hydrolase [Nevskia sp.]|nr:alpha/beta hydrolase [Nevskia sp.]
MSDSAMRAEPADAACYDSGGSAPVLLLLHGLCGTWHIWKPVLKLLESRHRVIALTLPGHQGGPDYAAEGDATVAGIAEQLIALLQARGIRQAHVAGNSLGGWLSLELARRGFALSVVALSPAGGWTTAADYRAVARPFRIIYALMPLILFLLGPFLGFAGLRRFLGRSTMEHADRVPTSEFRDSLRALANTRLLPGLLRAMGLHGPIAPMEAKVPIRIAWSERDAVIPFDRYGQPMLARISGAGSTMVSGAGHVPMYDNPQQVAEQILQISCAPQFESPAGAGMAA